MRTIAFACLVLLRCAAAQEVARHTVELAAVGRETDNASHYAYDSAGVHYQHIEQLFGGALLGYSYALSPGLAVEARAGYVFGRQPQIAQGGGEEVMAHVGLLATVPLRHSRFALRARVAPGVDSFSSAIRSQDVTYDFSNGVGIPTSIPHYGRITHFSLEQGLGLGVRLSPRTNLIFDVSHEILLDGDRSQPIADLGGEVLVLEKAFVEDHALVSVGVSRSFGRGFREPADVGSVREWAAAPRNELVLSYVVQPTVELAGDVLTNERGVALTGSHFLAKWLALDSSIVYLPRGDVPQFQDGGSQLQFLAGLKAGLQREHYGIFAKLRPGMVSFSHTYTQEGLDPPAVLADDLAGDLGAVVEAYPTRRVVVRVDAGATLVRYGAVTSNYTGIPGLFPAGTNTHPAQERAHGQFLVGAGWRF